MTYNPSAWVNRVVIACLALWSLVAIAGGLFALTLVLSACDITATVRFVCRGDTTPARDSVSLVKCGTLDSLKLHPDTTRRVP